MKVKKEKSIKLEIKKWNKDLTYFYFQISSFPSISQRDNYDETYYSSFSSISNSFFNIFKLKAKYSVRMEQTILSFSQFLTFPLTFQYEN